MLNVDRCDVKDPDLFELVGLDNLRMLYVHECELTEEKVDELNERMPKLAIFGR